MARRLLISCVCLLILLWLGSCASRSFRVPSDKSISPPDQAIGWEAYRQGIEVAALVDTGAPLRAWAVRIDLNEPNLKLMVSPGVDTPEAQAIFGEYLGLRTSSAARLYGWDIAVNGSPYTPFMYNEGSEADVVGLSISQGSLYSEAVTGYSVLMFHPAGEKGYKATISHDMASFSGAVEALGGFFEVLTAGVVDIPERFSGFAVERGPCTLVGTSIQGDLLYLLIVDGRQPGWSVGLTPWEAGDWLAYLGAHNGMYLDGGGSTTLVMRHDEGEPVVVNRPVDMDVLFKERVVANHLGFRSCR